MSGIYIPGMEMPKELTTILFHVNPEDGTVEIIPSLRYHEKYGDEKQKLPIIPVPEHGDLIDRDALSKRIKEETINQAEFYADRRHPVVLAYGDCYSKVQNAPTIIPADGKDIKVPTREEGE